MEHHQPTRVRRAVAAATVAATAALGVGLTAPAMAGPADAGPALERKAKQRGSVSGTVPLTCSVFGTDFAYAAKVKIKAVRAKGSKKVALRATFSKMPGVAPVPIDNGLRTTLKVKVGRAKASLKGSGHVTAGASQPVSVPSAKGTARMRTKAAIVTVTRLDVAVTDFDMTMGCTPSGKARLGKLRLK